jgi:hypothetical protein
MPGSNATILAHVDEVIQSMEFFPRNQFRIEPRCRVCRNEAVREKVNAMLASGSSYAMILRALGEDNARLDKHDRVTIDSIRNHTTRHFPVQNAAKATYRQILEQRAQENGVDFVQDVATAITPMAFLETVMVKGYETLVDPGTKVDVRTGMVAAGQLQALLGSRSSGTNVAALMAQMDRIVQAIHSTVPESMWPKILEQLDGPVTADAPADRLDARYDEDDEDDDWDQDDDDVLEDDDVWVPSARGA